ncbi:GIY-YIG nuclease family protein [Luminiphilus sp. nBUS_16]|uniref:GIY-YIG nuclease family protein n=1 Tax=Luminiphilus sp. nBUS_16 TaxID=3395315 RepID=UPI003EBEFAEB
MMPYNSTPRADEKCPPESVCWWVYLVRCADQTLYCGVTVNLPRRLRQHNGELVGGARYTRVRRPVELVWKKSASSRSEAQQFEAQMRRLSRQEKQMLIAEEKDDSP